MKTFIFRKLIFSGQVDKIEMSTVQEASVESFVYISLAKAYKL